MTIDEAILLLNSARYGWPSENIEKHYLALELGTEALKRVKSYRDKKFPVQGEELPGETTK